MFHAAGALLLVAADDVPEVFDDELDEPADELLLPELLLPESAFVELLLKTVL
jgi:hypothetical protein